MKRRPFEIVRVNDQMLRVLVARFPIASVFWHAGAPGRLPRGWVYALGQFGRVSEMQWSARSSGFSFAFDAAEAAVRAFKRKRKNLNAKYRKRYFSVAKSGRI